LVFIIFCSILYLLVSFFLYCSGTPSYLHSFPTRRSSDLDRNVAHAFLVAVRPAPRPGTDALQARTFVHVRRRHVQLVGVHIVVRLRVGRGGTHHFLHQTGRLLRREPEHVKSFVQRLALDELRHLPRLAGRNQYVASTGSGFHRFSSPPCYLLRVVRSSLPA